MDIALPAPLSALPKLQKLAKLFRQWGGIPKKHTLFVVTTPGSTKDYAEVFEGLPINIQPALTGVVRQPPMADNEVFYSVANAMKSSPFWFYLTPDTIPLTPDWADILENEYLASGKPYLGLAAYLPQRYRDSNGVDRVFPGDPYLLEAAIYPQNHFANKPPNLALSRVSHHEVMARNAVFPKAALSERIVSAEWDDKFRKSNAPKEVVLVSRVNGSALIDEMLGLPTVEPEAEVISRSEKEEPLTPQMDEAVWQSFPVKQPTIKVISSSQKQAEATTVTKRPRGRPRKS
jgi:hypothetical protein